MVDSTPLLTPIAATDLLQPQPEDNISPPLSLDDAIERCIGEFGWLQFLQVILISAVMIFDGQQSFISIFTDTDPTWHCTTPVASECGPATAYAGICQLRPESWTWDRPAWTSIQSEWNLQCSFGGSLLGGLPASSFFAGCLIGGFVLTTLADTSLGRKKLLLLSLLTMSLAALLTAASTNVWIYSALRFISGFGRAPIGSCVLVLIAELVAKKWRGQIGMIAFVCFTLGFLSLPALAYANRLSSWRALYLWTSIPAVLYGALVLLFVHESPRWLFMQGREQEALATLNKLAKREHQVSKLFHHHSPMLDYASEPRGSNVYAALKTLVDRRWAFRRLTAVMAMCFGIGFVYFGIPLGVGNLTFNLYLSTALNALIEVPTGLVAFFLLGSWSRRGSLAVFCTAGGLCSVACGAVGYAFGAELRGLQVALELVTFFSGCLAYVVLLTYVLELFPTCVRNSAVSVVRQAGVLSGAVCPMLVAAGSSSRGLLSYGVFGLGIQLCVVVLVYLPETKGASLCDTMDEQERKESCTSSSTVVV